MICHAPDSADREDELVGRAVEALARIHAAHDTTPADDGSGGDAFEGLLRRTIDEQLDHLRSCDGEGDVAPGELARLVADLQDAYLALRERRVLRRIEAHERAQESLERLRTAADPSLLLERATREICWSCGFERGVLSRIDGSQWILTGAHFEQHDDWAADFVRFGSSARPTLTHTLPEAQLARRGAPGIVIDAMRHPHTHKPFVEHSRAKCYVCTPIVSRGRVIGFFHADHHFSGRPVDEGDRDRLWAFTAGFAHVLERSVLLERLREQRVRFEDLAASTATVVSDLCDAEIGVEHRDGAPARIRTWAAAAATSDRNDGLHLTPREIEVLALMAAGATNAGIARELFISEGTVKSHVQRILRKLDASNRAEAVARYLRISADRRDARAAAADR